ncbi:protein kinase [Cordyceps militaris]|uniref:Protein kinase n=1 Tax=Cordyceps militaris TaxID=73501 RepID=A0A2H4S897_CORMI|nr:protein kinase [Cordyceps militaris]
MSFAQSEEQNHAVKAADLLTYDDRELDLFFATHDFSSLSGVLELSPEQRAHLSQRYRALQNLHSDSSGPKLVDPNQLAALLTDVAGNSSSFLFDRPPRSPAESTLTSSPPGTQPREDLCRQELIEDDGHPVCTAEELLDICAQPKISCNAILAWLSDEPDTETGKRELTTLFSNQLERWWDFRKSQWRNRADGNDEGDSGNEALAAYLAANARIYEGRGATGFVSDDSFEETLRRMWQRLSAWRQMPAEKQTFSAYRYAVQKRIRPYQFKRALRLKKDPRQQDSWTTLVEYLNYESWHWEQLTASAESLEPAFFASRILLDGRIMNSTPTVATKGSSLDEKLEAAQDMYRNNISAIRRAPLRSRHRELTFNFMEVIDNSDVIVVLVPLTEDARATTSMPWNQRRIPKARQSKIPWQEREETRSFDLNDLISNTDPPIVVTFSHGCKTRHGVVCGTAQSADLALPDIPRVSKVHIAITFDCKTNKPVIRDLGSTCGTVVTFDGKQATPLSNFQWQLIGPRIAEDKYPVLRITNDLQFKVIVPTHDFTSPDYIEKVKKFLLGTAQAEDLLHSLVLQTGQRTQQPSGTRTPPTGPVCYQRKLGEGAFGVVLFFWEINTGEEYVVKSPLESLRHDPFTQEIFMSEAVIMRNISHEHIVALLSASLDPYPQLRLEYVPEGPLHKLENISGLEGAKILWQLSSALGYLHNQSPSIVHRDIKPENILVAERTQENIRVKFADFGLSKASEILKTYCGTLKWAAPEVHRKASGSQETKEETYTPAVDIWSLGVVIASLVYNKFPKYEKGWRNDANAWVDALEAHFKNIYTNVFNKQNDLLRLVIDRMLVKDPAKRWSADDIHDEAGRIVERMERMASAAPVYDVGKGPLRPNLPFVYETPTVVRNPLMEPPATEAYDSPNDPLNQGRDKVAATPKLVDVSKASTVRLGREPGLEGSPLTSPAREHENRSNQIPAVPRSLVGKTIVREQLQKLGGSKRSRSVRKPGQGAVETHAERESMCKREASGASGGSSSRPPESVVRIASTAEACPANDNDTRCHKRTKTNARS